MKIAVTGGTGFVGKYLVAELADRGHDVSAISRTPADGALPDGVTPVSADVRSKADLDAAFEGMDAVVNLVALTPLFKTPRGVTHHDVHVQGTSNVIDAMETAGVSRLVQMSALGADPNGTTAYIRAKGDAEHRVRSSELDWVIVRPSIIFGDGDEFTGFTSLLTTPYVAALPGGGHTRFQPIHIHDMVAILADAVEDDAHVGESYDIAGPQVLTLADVAKRIERAKGRGLSVVSIPMPLVKLGMTVGEYVPFVPMGRDQYFGLEFDNTTRDNDIEAFGLEPADLTTYDEYLTGEVKPRRRRVEA